MQISKVFTNLKKCIKYHSSIIWMLVFHLSQHLTHYLSSISFYCEVYRCFRELLILNYVVFFFFWTFYLRNRKLHSPHVSSKRDKKCSKKRWYSIRITCNKNISRPYIERLDLHIISFEAFPIHRLISREYFI